MWRLPVAALLLVGPGCSAATSSETPAGDSILFIGNSLTYTNDLPAMVERVADAAGRAVRAGMAAGPDMAVIDHTVVGSDAIARIGERDWAHVVLQQGPTPPGICRDTLVIAAMRLAPRIRAAGGRPVLFLPWARRAAPQSLPWAGESATAAARAVGGAVVPVGIAWKKAVDRDRDLPLYSGDGYHPAPAGTLLAALTIYDRLSGTDVRRIPSSALSTIAGVSLAPSQLEAMVEAAHAASVEFPSDPLDPVPTDTTSISRSGGPC